MTPNQLNDDQSDHVFDVEESRLRFQLGMENNLKKQVAQLFDQRIHILRLDRLDNLVTLLYEVSLQRLMVLLAVPGAASLAAESCHDPNQVVERFLTLVCRQGRNIHGSKMIDLNPVQIM